MKKIVCLLFIGGLFAVICAHPADDAAAAATAKAKSEAKGATDGVSKDTDLAKKADPKAAIAAMTKEAKDLNPTNVAALTGKFMATIMGDCENFIQGVLSPSPSALPGVGEISKMTKLFNPLEIGKDVVDDVLKVFGGAPSKPQKDDKDAAKDKAANGAEAAGKKADDKANAAKEAKPDEGKDIVAKVEDTGKDMMGGLFKAFGF